MVKYSSKNIVTKAGINCVKTLIESINCIFFEVHQENDIGIDAFIEFVKDEIPMGKMIALQIKSGKSYLNKDRSICKIPIGKHFKYWKNHILPVIGIVYDDLESKAYWHNLSETLKQYPNEQPKNIKHIKFSKTKLNMLTTEGLLKIFIPIMTGQEIGMDYNLAINYFRSDEAEEILIGQKALYKTYKDKPAAIKELIEYFIRKPIEWISPALIYYFATIPWHMDCFPVGKTDFSIDSRNMGKKLIANFKEPEIVKLLAFISEHDFGRGTMGQNIEAIVSLVTNIDSKLLVIMRNASYSYEIRCNAAILYAIRNQMKSLEVLEEFSNSIHSSFLREIVIYLKENGYLSFI